RLIRIALPDETVGEPVLGQHGTVAAPGVRVRDAPDRDAVSVGQVEQFPDAGAYFVRRERRGHLEEYVARFGDEQRSRGVVEVGDEEITDDLARREFAGSTPPALRVLPVFQSRQARLDRGAHALGIR